MNARRTSSEPAPQLAGALEMIRRGRAANAALETATDSPAVDPATGDDQLRNPPPATRPLAGSSGEHPITVDASHGTGTSSGGVGERTLEHRPAGGTPPHSDHSDHSGDLTDVVDLTSPGAAVVSPDRTADEVVAAPGAARPQPPRRRRQPATSPAPPARTDPTAGEGADAQPRRLRADGVPFTVLLNRNLRTKVQTWTLACRRLRKRPSNVELIVAAAHRWHPDQTGKFLDWLERYEPIGLATPDASRFSARVDPQLIEHLDLTCAELGLHFDVRIPRQALMMFLLEQELDHRIATDSTTDGDPGSGQRR